MVYLRASNCGRLADKDITAIVVFDGIGLTLITVLTIENLIWSSSMIVDCAKPRIFGSGVSAVVHLSLTLSGRNVGWLNLLVCVNNRGVDILLFHHHPQCFVSCREFELIKVLLSELNGEGAILSSCTIWFSVLSRSLEIIISFVPNSSALDSANQGPTFCVWVQWSFWGRSFWGRSCGRDGVDNHHVRVQVETEGHGTRQLNLCVDSRGNTGCFNS